MNTKLSILRNITRLFLIVIVCVLVAGAVPVSAQDTGPQSPCGGLPECGYILMHVQHVTTAMPDCGQIPECGYIQMHSQGSGLHTVVTVVSLTKAGIPVTGCSDSLYIGQGYSLVCGVLHSYGQ